MPGYTATASECMSYRYMYATLLHTNDPTPRTMPRTAYAFKLGMRAAPRCSLAASFDSASVTDSADRFNMVAAAEAGGARGSAMLAASGEGRARVQVASLLGPNRTPLHTFSAWSLVSARMRARPVRSTEVKG